MVFVELVVLPVFLFVSIGWCDCQIVLITSFLWNTRANKHFSFYHWFFEVSSAYFPSICFNHRHFVIKLIIWLFFCCKYSYYLFICFYLHVLWSFVLMELELPQCYSIDIIFNYCQCQWLLGKLDILPINLWTYNYHSSCNNTKTCKQTLWKTLSYADLFMTRLH